MKGKLYQIAKEYARNDNVTKSVKYYKKYDDFFEKNNFAPETILEIGVFNGQSTKIISKAFPDAKIIALDLSLKEIDFSNYPNVKYMQANQIRTEELGVIVKSEFPDGVDLIIDDASHIGAYSLITFNCLFPFLNFNGVYIIEDWGTGYWDSWLDGGRYQEYPTSFFDEKPPKRIPSHDFGMVGFVKSLVDMTHEKAIRKDKKNVSDHKTRLKLLEFTEGVCFAMKAAE